jgi:hypothetical protein
MADLTAADVTITILHQKRTRAEKVTQFKAEYGDAALTYPTGGVPLPAGASFGLPNSLRQIVLTDTDAAQAVSLKLCATTHCVRHYLPTQQTADTGNRAGVEYEGGTTAVPATVLYGEAYGW